MAYLGTPFRLAYEAKNFRPGLTDVKALVTKPDSTFAGVFTMREMPFVSFQGVYVYDLMTSNGDPEGEWIVIYYSPSEGVKTSSRLSMQRNPAAAIQALISNFLANGIVEEMQGYVDFSREYTTQIDLSGELVGFIEEDDIHAEIEPNFETTGHSESTLELDGEIDHEL